MKLNSDLNADKEAALKVFESDFKMWIDDRTWHYIIAPILPTTISGVPPTVTACRKLKPPERRAILRRWGRVGLSEVSKRTCES